MKLDVVTPQGAKVKDVEVREVTLPGLLGEMGVLPGHEAMIAALGIGPMVLETPAGRETFALASGFVEVLGDRVSVLAETCERSDEIDVTRAKAKVDEDVRRLHDVHPVEGEAYNVLAASLKKAETRVRVAGGK
ncbi:MAG: ATP synthase F1 subunit epsilon [Deltaproteobacteria bacterium]|nr:ATP synthase F1 subunit epsilon [Deltaproteobacteria bacterium]